MSRHGSQAGNPARGGSRKSTFVFFHGIGYGTGYRTLVQNLVWLQDQDSTLTSRVVLEQHRKLNSLNSVQIALACSKTTPAWNFEPTFLLAACLSGRYSIRFNVLMQRKQLGSSNVGPPGSGGMTLGMAKCEQPPAPACYATCGPKNKGLYRLHQTPTS